MYPSSIYDTSFPSWKLTSLSTIPSSSSLVSAHTSAPSPATIRISSLVLGGAGPVRVSALATLSGLEPCGVLWLDDPFDLTELGLEGVPPVLETMTELFGLHCDPCVNVATDGLSGLVWEAYDTSAPSGVSNSVVCMEGGESSWERYVCRVGRTSIVLVGPIQGWLRIAIFKDSIQ